MKFFFPLVLFSFLLSSCGGKSPESISEEVAAFIGQNKQVSSFGLVRVKDILIKSDYQQIEKAGALINKEWDIVQKVLNTEEAAYLAMENSAETPTKTTLYAFAVVKNRDSLVANVKRHGYAVKKDKAFDFHESNDVAFAITDSRVVLITEPQLKNGAEKLKKALADMKKDVPKSEVLNILNRKGDIVFGTDLQASFLTAGENLKLSAEKIKEIENKMKDCYTASSLYFENGQMRMEVDYLLTDSMKKMVEFGKESKDILSKLGSGKPQMGFIMDVDMKKTEAFWNQIFPDFFNEIGKKAGGQAQFALAMLGDKGVSGAITGKMGVVMFNEPKENETHFNFHVGIGDALLPLAKNFSEGMKKNMSSLQISGNYFTGSSSAIFAKQGNLTLPRGCENFGAKPISFFLDFSAVQNKSVQQMSGELDLSEMDYLFAEGDDKTFNMIVKSKKPKENFLKTMVKLAEANIELKNKQNQSFDL
jgi:hypothetical protein